MQSLRHSSHPSIVSSQMLSKVSQINFQEEASQALEKFQHSWFSTVDFLLYLFVAFLFFSLGQSYSQLQLKAQERANRQLGYQSYHPGSKAAKIKTDEPDEERMTYSDEQQLVELQSIRGELADSKQEVKSLSEQLRRLKQREIQLTSENQLLRSKADQTQAQF